MREQKDSNSVSWVTVGVVIGLAAAAVVAPHFSRGYYPGDDLDFHASLWFETARHWREGVVYARWAAQAVFGYGDPGLLFYPPVSRLLGGALLTCLPSNMVVGTFEWLGLVLGGFTFFHLCRGFFDGRSSLAAAFVYVLNPYNLILLYIRSALAEFLAAALFPLVLLAAYRLGRNGKRGIARLAIPLALVWLTDIPAAVITNYAAATFVIVLARARRSKSILGLFALAEVLGAGLAAFYLLPAWYQKPWIHVEEILGYNPLNFFLLSWWGPAPGRHVPALLTGFFWMVLIGSVAWLYSRQALANRREASWAFGMVMVVSAYMSLPVSAVVWMFVPGLEYVQFPWRWLFPLSVAAAFFIPPAMSQVKKGSWLPVVACLWSLLCIPAFFSLSKGMLNWSTLQTPLEANAGYGVRQEYLPRVAGVVPSFAIPIPPVPSWLPSPRVAFLNSGRKDGQSSENPGTTFAPANNARIAVESWSGQSRSFVVDTPQPARVRVRLFNYPGWRAFLNGMEIHPVEQDERGAIVLRVPSGHSRIQLEFKRTPDETFGMIVSGIALIPVLSLLFSRRSCV